MHTIDLSISSIFLQATGVVQAVLLLLVFCSVGCWAIILGKAASMIGLSRQLRLLEAMVAGEVVLMGRPNLAHAIVQAGREEGATYHPGESVSERRGRIEAGMRATLQEGLGRAATRLSYLATIGSSAPFVGLFGTVWGIMHSFAAIAANNDTSLAVVAPGIAEALSTTAIGLAAAIPASVAYNKFAADFHALGRRFSIAIGRLGRQPDGALLSVAP